MILCTMKDVGMKELPHLPPDEPPRYGRTGVVFIYQKTERMTPMGAKGKYEAWLTPESLQLIQGWARDGNLLKDIAAKMGVALSTLCEWQNRFPELAEALKKGKEVVDYEVENALLNKARSGDVTAMIFWLKNRRPDKWRDKQEVVNDNSVKFVFEDIEEDGELSG